MKMEKAGRRSHYRGNLIACGIVAFAVATSVPVTSAESEDGTPPGMLAFFMTTGGCPAGWEVATVAHGRAIVAVQDSEDVGTVVGLTAISKATPPEHSHSYDTSVKLPYKSVSLASGDGNHGGAKARSYTVEGSVYTDPSNLPFIQLAACQKQ